MLESEDSTQSSVRISVILTAYKRTVFIANALASLDSQTYSKSKFEVVVVASFKIPDGFVIPRELRVVWKVCEDYNKRTQLLEALNASKGEILCFLDDDDIFVPQKLSYVSNVFSTYPEVGMYRNNLKFIDVSGIERGDPTPSHRKYILKKTRILVNLRNRNAIERLWRAHAYFNASTMSMRREIAASFVAASRGELFGVDFFFFYASLLSGYDILTDAEPLTLYRVHKSSFTATTPPLNGYRKFSNCWINIRRLSRGKNDIVYYHSSLILEMSKVLLLQQIGVSQQRLYFKIFLRILLHYPKGVITYLGSHGFFGVYSFFKLIKGCYIGSDFR